MSSTAAKPLVGKRVLVTRPEGQADRLIAGIRDLGGDVTHIPLLAIDSMPDQSALENIAAHLGDYRACIFISANAVRLAWSQLSQDGWPQQVASAAVGPGTAHALHALGVPEVILPASRFDSEGLLATTFFGEQQCRGQAFALIRGAGGRDFLAQTLRGRGARVDEAAVYQRRLHPEALNRLAPWMAAGEGGDPGLLLISSSESLARLIAVAPPDLVSQLKRLPLLVPHHRIADSAKRLGFESILTSAGGDEGFLAFLRSYNEPRDITMNDGTATP